MKKKIKKINFRKLGFISGLEIHQQLNTAHKLFCRCPAGLQNREPDAEILRHMRPTLSELGEYDGAALMEFKTKKQVVYQLYEDSMCTYEMDDTPPFPINMQALEIAIEIALAFNCNIVDEIHISRKQYLDGSIPTGFQRTTVIGTDGWIPYKGRKIKITHVTLEEDACREVSDIGHTIVFKTDRLSTPLVEIITDADMRTPKEVQEVDEILGRVMRTTGKVKRGIGTVRQDVNVSIKGGSRVEIKGVPRTQYIEKLTEIEALRQKALLDIRKEIAKRDNAPKNLKCNKKDVTELLKNTNCKILQEALSNNLRIKAISLNKYAGLLNYPTQPGLTFADELSGRVRVIACLDSKPNILHTDEPLAYDMSEEDWNILRKDLNSSKKDTIVIVWGREEDTNTALNEIKIRATSDIIGVPKETRQHFVNGTTDFERILPGADRMYPDTDSPPIAVTDELLDKIKSRLPEPLWIKEARYRKMGLSNELIKPLVISQYSGLFDKIVKEIKIKPKLAACTFICIFKDLKRKGYNTEKLTEEKIFKTFKSFSRKLARNKHAKQLIQKTFGKLIKS